MKMMKYPFKMSKVSFQESLGHLKNFNRTKTVIQFIVLQLLQTLFRHIHFFTYPILMISF